MPIQRRQQLRHAVPGRGGRDQHVRPLRPGPRRNVGHAGRLVPRRRGHQHRPQLRGGPLRARLVALVHHDEVGDLQQARLDRLDLVAHLGRLEDDRRIGRGRHLHLALARADGLDEDQVEPGRVEHRRRGRRRGRQPSGVSARRHRADEDVPILGIRLHPDAIAQQRPAGDRARRIDGDDRHGPTRPPDLRDQGRHERRFPGPRRPGDPDEMRPSGHRVEAPKGGLGDGGPVLDRGQETGQRQSVARDGRLAQLSRPGRGIGRHG